jgi:hypothetical protein
MSPQFFTFFDRPALVLCDSEDAVRLACPTHLCLPPPLLALFAPHLLHRLVACALPGMVSIDLLYFLLIFYLGCRHTLCIHVCRFGPCSQIFVE